MVLSAELEGPIRGDELEPLYLAFSGSCFHGAVFINDNPAALFLLRGALVVGEGTRLQHAPVLAHGWKEVAAFQ